MPLPDAEPAPDKANIYEQFSSIKVSDFTRTQLDIVRDPLYLNSESEDVLRRLLLLGSVTNQLSSSGAIPGTGQVIVTGNIEATGNIDVFQPEVGESYRLQTISIDPSGSGTKRVIGYLYDATSTELTEIFDTGNFTTEAEEIKFQGPLSLDNNLYFRVNIAAAGVGNGSNIKCAVIQDR